MEIEFQPTAALADGRHYVACRVLSGEVVFQPTAALADGRHGV